MLPARLTVRSSANFPALSGSRGAVTKPIGAPALVGLGRHRDVLNTAPVGDTTPIISPGRVEYPEQIVLNTRDSRFDLNTTYGAVALADLSYQLDGGRVLWQLKKWGFHDAKLYNWEAATAQAFSATRGDAHVVSARGTDALQDVLLDIFAINPNPDTTLTDAAVHRGFRTAVNGLYRPGQRDLQLDSRFYGAALGAWAKLIGKKTAEAMPSNLHDDVRGQVVRRHQDPRKLFLIGHSLGGAMATLIAARFQHEWNTSLPRLDGTHLQGAPVHQVYTFGSPAVGLRRFRDLHTALGLDERTTAVAHGSDPITLIPFGLLSPFTDGSSFYHVGNKRRLFLGPDESLTVGVTNLQRLKNFNPLKPTDHLLHHYVNRIAALAKNGGPELQAQIRRQLAVIDAG